MCNIPFKGQGGLGTQPKSLVSPISKVCHITAQLLGDKGTVWEEGGVEGGRGKGGEGRR